MNSIAILDCNVKDGTDFIDNFARYESQKLRETKDIAVAVGMDEKVKKYKGTWDPQYFVMHFMKSKELYRGHKREYE